ncbi:MAG TPA: vanadium-dependent haloperoxidase [Gemmatimonadaceae bacterium]|nr:vanadium-dependent haloperoxidase [Gemmatimonadaceae bacterium]
MRHRILLLPALAGALAGALAAAAAALQGCARASARERAPLAEAELLHSAVGQLSGVIVYDIFSPPQASRAYAYASIAAYEALRPGHPEFRTLAGQLNGLAPVPAPDSGVEYSLPLAGVHAFMTVGKALTFSRARMDSLRAAMDERIRRGGRGMPEPVYARSIAYGEKVAEHILAWSKGDHYLQTRGMPKYTVTSEPGRWIPTPPAYMDAVEPNWARLRPFVMDSASQLRAEPPLPFDTAKGSAYWREVMEVYEAGRRVSDEQRAFVSFWDCNPYVMHVQGHAMFATKKITPGGHWMGIVAGASRKADADIMRSAAAYARTAVALADGFIASWDMKFSTNVIRPETVINRYLDEAWEPLLQTPPFPEYTSGHSVISTAAAQVLTDEFGPAFAFVDSTEMEYGLPPRAFGSFEQAAAEAAMSRLYGGIHFRRSIEQGVIEGRQVGQLVVRRVRTRDGAGPRVVASAPPRTLGATSASGGH